MRRFVAWLHVAQQSVKGSFLGLSTTAVLVAILGACGDPLSSSSGLLVVSNTTTGGAFDPNGFVVRGVTWAPTALDLNESRVLAGLAAGTYAVELGDIAPNCQPRDGTVRNITIRSGSTARLHFEVVCTPPRELARLRIVYSSAKGLPMGFSRIVAMNADGSGPVDLSSGTFADVHPDASPDGQTIVFQSNRDDNPNGYPDLHLLSAHGSAHAVLIQGPAYEPAWSPDGSTIAFIRPLGAFGTGHIQTVGVDGGGVRQLTTLDTSLEHNWGDSRPAWSPDGGRLVFLRWDNHVGNSSMWIINADGSGETRLTEPALETGMSPVWSPDGGRIAFSDYDWSTGAGTSRTYSINTDGSGITTLLETQGEPFAVTDWSADGKYLLLGRSNDLYLLRLADGTMMRLTADGSYRNNAGAGFWPITPTLAKQ